MTLQKRRIMISIVYYYTSSDFLIRTFTDEILIFYISSVAIVVANIVTHLTYAPS